MELPTNSKLKKTETVDDSDDVTSKQTEPKKARIATNQDDDDLTHLLHDEDDDLAFYAVPNDGVSSTTRKTVEDARSQEKGPKEFTVLSWNIDGLEEECLSERFQGALKVILTKQPTIVMLQEMTEEIFLPLMILFSSVYEIRTLTQRTYFNAIMFLKKSPLEVIGELGGCFFPSSKMERHYISQKVRIHGRPVTLMTSHLESLKEGATERQNQLAKCFKMMKDSPDDCSFIFGGDLNMRVADLKKVGGIPPKITDVWETTGENPTTKFTWDLELNDNKRFPNCKPRARFDRIYFKRAQSGGAMQCVGFELVGLNRLSCGMFPSDHFGLLAKFILTDD